MLTNLLHWCSKAFVSVNHQLLIQKLYLFINFSQHACTLLFRNISFLRVAQGVPPGSVIAPLLFAIFRFSLMIYLNLYYHGEPQNMSEVHCSLFPFYFKLDSKDSKI